MTRRSARSILALLLALLVAVPLVAAPSASASDNFVLANETLSQDFEPFSVDLVEEGCWYEPSGVFSSRPQDQGEYSVIVGDAGFGCENRSWGAALTYTRDSEHVGVIGFEAHDPFIGASSLECAARGRPYEEANSLVPIERFMTTEVDGRVCKVNWVPGISPGHTDLATLSDRAFAGHVRLVSSLARVAGGRAQVKVEVFGLGSARHRVTVTLRDPAGRPIGEGTRVLPVSDRPRTISVPLSAAMRAPLQNKHELRIRAAVDIASHGGTGDRTTQLLLSSRR